nr:protein G6b isoform X2 [Odocoileus virginianus texanus]XP_020752884.1 protein G6b isoform X2 [Odocoileus virginianus texanus]
MTLVLQLLQLLPLLLLSRAQGDPGASLNGHPGDRVNLSCIGVSQPTRWVWAPRFPACKGLSKGRRPILWASPSGTPTVSPAQPFAGRINALDLGIRRLELLLSAGDSGTFICKGRQDEESRTELHVLGDRAYCKALGSSYSQILIPLLGTGLVLGLGVVGWACWRRRRSPPHPPRPTPRFGETNSPALFLIRTFPTQCLSLSPCREQTSWSPSLNPSALSPPHSFTRESRAPEARRGGRAQDVRGPGSGAGWCHPQPVLSLYFNCKQHPEFPPVPISDMRIPNCPSDIPAWLTLGILHTAGPKANALSFPKPLI